MSPLAIGVGITAGVIVLALQGAGDDWRFQTADERRAREARAAERRQAIGFGFGLLFLIWGVAVDTLFWRILWLLLAGAFAAPMAVALTAAFVRRHKKRAAAPSPRPIGRAGRPTA